MKLLDDLFKAILCKYGKIDSTNYVALNEELETRIINPIKTLDIRHVEIEIPKIQTYFLSEDFIAKKSYSSSSYYAKSGKTNVTENQKDELLKAGWYDNSIIFSNSFIGYGLSPFGESFVAHTHSSSSSIVNEEEFMKKVSEFYLYVKPKTYGESWVSIISKGNGVGNRNDSYREITIEFHANFDTICENCDIDVEKLQQEFDKFIHDWTVVKKEYYLEIDVKDNETINPDAVYQDYKDSHYKKGFDTFKVIEKDSDYRRVREIENTIYNNGVIHRTTRSVFIIKDNVLQTTGWGGYSDCENIFLERND